MNAELEVAAEQILALRTDLESEKTAKKTAIERAEDAEAKLETAQVELAQLQSLRELAQSIGQGEPRRASRGNNDGREERGLLEEEDNDWQYASRRGNSRGNQNNPRLQYRDNRDEQKKRGPDKNSIFDLRDRDNNKYCQFQFTKPEGCEKGHGCRFANTHGMDDPHPDHESRQRKRPKIMRAPAARDKDKDPRGGKGDKREEDKDEDPLYDVD